MLSRFFIDRPVFASVIAIVIVVAGLISIPLLPVGEFPQVVPPTVVVSATYTGGSAEVVEEAVTIPLEEQINGVQGMVYMSSTSSMTARRTSRSPSKRAIVSILRRWIPRTGCRPRWLNCRTKWSPRA